MANSGFNISEQTLTQAVNGVNTCASTMRTTMSTLDGQLSALHGNYQGQQQVAFVKAHTTAQDFSTRLNKDLQAMEELLGQAGASYGHGDSDVSADLSSLAGRDPSGYGGLGI
jgi:WXG100 family type VII secretion target